MNYSEACDVLRENLNLPKTVCWQALLVACAEKYQEDEFNENVKNSINFVEDKKEEKPNITEEPVVKSQKEKKDVKRTKGTRKPNRNTRNSK